MCLHFLKEAQAVQADPKEVQVAKVLEVVKAARAVKKVPEAAKAAREAVKDDREQAAVIAADSASKPSATRPKIPCCNASADPTPVSTSLTNKVQVVTEALVVPAVPEVPVVLVVLVVMEDLEVVITTVLAQAALVAPEVTDSKEANSSFSKLARTTKPMPIKPRPVCPTPS